MMREEGTLEERAEALMAYVEYQMRGNFLVYLAERFGKDALMSAALEVTALGGRTRAEKLAEIAFDLVPGQIKKVYKAYSAIVHIARRPGINFKWVDDEGLPAIAPFGNDIVLEPRRWRAWAEFDFDEETGTLAVRDVQDTPGGLFWL